MRGLIRGIVIVVGVAVALGAIALFGLIERGVSARATPSRFEMAAAGRVRHLAIPREARERTNPVPASADSVKDGMEHFADHCAVCHDNNGSGDTMYGRGLYPRPPDLRGHTQALSDGELAWIITNGVRLTGMPAFGGDHGEEDTWKLVNFIRHLPTITPAELDAMKKLNPHGADEDEDAHHHEK